MLNRIRTILAILIVAPLGGCIALAGAGSYSIGYRSTSEVFVGHTTDGDKNDARASSDVDLGPLADLFESADKPASPSTSGD